VVVRRVSVISNPSFIFPAALPDLDLNMLLAAVGARGARNQTRNELATLRPDLVEGHNWWALL